MMQQQVSSAVLTAKIRNVFGYCVMAATFCLPVAAQLNQTDEAARQLAAAPKINFNKYFRFASSATVPPDQVVLVPNGTFAGIGTSDPQHVLHVEGITEILSTGSGAGFKFRDRSSNSWNDDWVWYSMGNVARFWRSGFGDIIGVTPTGNLGIGTSTPDTKLTVNGGISLQLFTGGTMPLCQNGQSRIATCSSSLRYKHNINSFSPGLALITRLRPVSFNWNAGNDADLGLIAEDVAKIDLRLVTHNDKGEIEGVKYDRLGVLVINAVKEQQSEIEHLKQEISALKGLVCAVNSAAEICRGSSGPGNRR